MAKGMETELRIPFGSAGEAEIVYNSLRVEVEPARSKVGSSTWKCAGVRSEMLRNRRNDNFFGVAEPEPEYN